LSNVFLPLAMFRFLLLLPLFIHPLSGGITGEQGTFVQRFSADCHRLRFTKTSAGTDRLGNALAAS
jgi:hypothetical protein